MWLKGKRIHFLGDSITQGVGTSDPQNGFVNLIAVKEGAICRNYGISGTRIARQNRPSEDPSFDLDFPSRVAGMDPEAEIVVVFGGTNDFGHGDAPLGTMADRTDDPFYGGLPVLYRRLIEKYPDADFVVLPPLHRLNEDDPCGDGAKPGKAGVLEDYVHAIRAVAQYYALPVLDLFACGKMQPKIPVLMERYMPDGLHPNDAGHALLAGKIISFLKTL